MSDVDVIIQVHTQGVQQIGNLSASLRNLGNTLRGISVPMSKLDAHTKAVHKALGITSRGVDQHAKSIRELAANQKVLSLESRKLKSDINNLRNIYVLAGGSATELGREVAYTTRQLQAFSRTFRGMRLRAIGSDFHNISLRMSKLGKDAQFVGRSLLINLTLPIAAFAKLGLQSFLAVEKQMVRITKVMENLAPTMDVAAQKIYRLTDAQKQMGMTMDDISAKDLTTPEQIKQAELMVQNFKNMDKAITNMSLKFAVSKDLVASISADFGELGLTASENVQKLTQLTLEIEKLGNMDIGPAQDLTQALYFQSRRALELTGALSKVTTARGREQKAIEASITQMYLFNAIENATALTLKDLGEAFAEVSAMAVSYGLSMTEAAAMLAPMKAAGLDVGASANSIKVSLQRLLAPTKQNVETLKDLAEQYGVAENKQNEFLLSTRTGLTGLDAVVKVFDRVKYSMTGMANNSEGALRLMSDLFEKRQGPRMYLAIEQLSDFNRELQKADTQFRGIKGSSTSAEVQLARAAESAVKGFSNYNTTIVPKTIRSFKDIGIVARIASAYAGQLIELEPGKEKFITHADIQNAKAMRKATSDFILEAKQAKGIDIVSEVKHEAGRAMMIELAGAANAQQVAQQELERTLRSTYTAVERVKNAFKLFAIDIFQRLAPTLDKISKKVVEMYEKWVSPEFERTRQSIINMITTLGSFLAVVGPIILSVGTLQSVIGNVGLGMARIFPKLRTAEQSFQGLGRSVDIARSSMNKFYEAFVRATAGRRGAGDAALRPTAAGRIPVLPQAMTPARKARLLDDAKREAMRTAGLTARESRMAHDEFRKGTKAPLTGGRARGSTGRFLPKNVVEGLRILEAHGLAGVTPTELGSPLSTGRFASRTEGMLAQVRRQESIFARSQYFERAGIATDRMGTQFVRGGRRITEDQANRIARGGIGSAIARTQIATSAVGQRAMAPFRAIGRAGTAARAAMAAPGAGLIHGAGAATHSFLAHTKAMQGATAALAAYNAKAMVFNNGVANNATGLKKAAIATLGFVRNMKLATIATKLFRMALLFTGVGAIIAGIAAVVFLVVKNMDKIKGATKAWDALKRAFGLIKDAAMEVVRPIQDLFASFGTGGDQGEKAGNGIAKAFEGIAKAIEFVAGIIKILVEKVIKPYLYGIVNVVMAVVQLFKGNWKGALKFLIAAVSQVATGIISLWQMFAKIMISINLALVKGIVTLFFKGIVNGLIQAVLLAIRGVVNLLGKIPGLSRFTNPINNALKNVGGFVSNMTSKAANGINGVIDNVGNFAKKSVDFVGDTLKKGLKKGADLGIKASQGAIRSDKKVPEAAKEQGELAGEAISDAFGDAPIEDANEKIAGKIKEGIMDAVQKLQDFIADRFASSLKKFISDSLKALNKQKESALKVFDVQINTLMKLEKAEESLTKKKEYETNRRKIIDDATLRGEQYRRNRALAIYEGRIDDARILDLEEQQATKESQQEISTLDEGRRKELAKENLDALREAINNAKELAGKFFDESIEKFQEAAEHITRIAPVTLEQYTAQLNELQTLTTKTAEDNNVKFGDMFVKFATTINEKMPNVVDDFGNAIGAFTTPLDELVKLAEAKYGLGSEDEATILGVTRKMADAVIGITLGMLVDIGDTFGDNTASIIEKYGPITSGIKGANDAMATDGTDAANAMNTGMTAAFQGLKTSVLGIFASLLEETKTAFLTPYKKALDEADPHTVFKNAIVDGNETILRSFQNLVELNPDLMKRLAASLDPAIKKYIALKAAIDAAKDAASGSTPGDPGGSYMDPFERAEFNRFMRIQDTAVAGFRGIHGTDAVVRGLSVDQIVNAIAIANLKTINYGKAQPGLPYGNFPRPQGRAGFTETRMINPTAIRRAEGGPIPGSSRLEATPYGISGFLNAPEQQAIPAVLHGGEFIINADAVKRVGLGALAKLNDPRIPKFKKGGLVGVPDRIERQALAAAKTNAKTNLLIGTADAAERKTLAAAKTSAMSGRGSSSLPDAIEANIKRTQTLLADPKIQTGLVSSLGVAGAKRIIERIEEPFAAAKVIAQKKKEVNTVMREIQSLRDDAGGRKLLNAIAINTAQQQRTESLRQDVSGRKLLPRIVDMTPRRADGSSLNPEVPPQSSTPLTNLIKGAGNIVMGVGRGIGGLTTGNTELGKRGLSQILKGGKDFFNPVNLIPGLLFELPKEILMGFGRTLSGKNLIWGKNSVARTLGQVGLSLLGAGEMPTLDDWKYMGINLVEDLMNVGTIFTLGGSALAKPLVTTSLKSLVKQGVAQQGEAFIGSMIRATGDDLLQASIARTLAQGARGEISQEYAKELATNQLFNYYKQKTGTAFLQNMYDISNPRIRQGALNIWAKTVGKETPRAALPNMLTAYKTFKAFDPDAAVQAIIRQGDLIATARGGQSAIGAGKIITNPVVNGIMDELLPGVSKNTVIQAIHSKPLALGMGDASGRSLPVSLFNQNLQNPITVVSGSRTVIGASRLDEDLTKTTGQWVRGWMEDVTAHADVSQKGFLLEGQYFNPLPNLVGNKPVGFGFNVGSPATALKVFPDLPRNTTLVQAQPYEILDTALGHVHAGGGIATRDFYNSALGAEHKMKTITDRFSPSQVDEKAYGFVYDYAHAQGAPGSIREYLEMAKTWAKRLENDLAFYAKNPQYGVKTVDDLWKDFTSYNDDFENITLDEFNSFIGKIPKFGENLTPQQIDYIALNAANGNAEAKSMFDQLANFGKDVRKLKIDAIAKKVAKQPFDKRLNLGNTMVVREELGQFPMFKIQPDGSMTLHSRSSLTHDPNTRRAIDRHTMHSALNHIVHGGTMFGRPNVPGANFIITKLEDLLKYNPGSLNTLLGYDTNFVALPFGGIRLPAGKYNLFREGFEVFPTYPAVRDPYIDSIMQAAYRQTHRLYSLADWQNWQVMKQNELAYAQQYAAAQKLKIEEAIIEEAFYRSSIIHSGNPMGIDLNELLEPVLHGNARGSKTMDYYNYMVGVQNWSESTGFAARRDSTHLVDDLKTFLYNQQAKYVTDIRQGMYGQYLHDYDKVLAYYEKLYPELVDQFNPDYTSRPIYDMIAAAHPEIVGPHIQETVTRNFVRRKLFGDPDLGNYGAPAVKAGQQEIDPDAQMAFNRIGLSLPDPVIPVFHPDMYAAHGVELPRDSFSMDGVHSISNLTQIGRNQILRNYASDSTWIQDYLGYFPGRFTRLKIIAQQPWEKILAAQQLQLPSSTSIKLALGLARQEGMLIPRVTKATEQVAKTMPYYKLDATLGDLMGWGEFLPPGFTPDDVSTPLGRMQMQIETGMGRINRPLRPKTVSLGGVNYPVNVGMKHPLEMTRGEYGLFPDSGFSFINNEDIMAGLGIELRKQWNLRAGGMPPGEIYELLSKQYGLSPKLVQRYINEVSGRTFFDEPFIIPPEMTGVEGINTVRALAPEPKAIASTAYMARNPNTHTEAVAKFQDFIEGIFKYSSQDIEMRRFYAPVLDAFADELSARPPVDYESVYKAMAKSVVTKKYQGVRTGQRDQVLSLSASELLARRGYEHQLVDKLFEETIDIPWWTNFIDELISRENVATRFDLSLFKDFGRLELGAGFLKAKEDVLKAVLQPREIQSIVNNLKRKVSSGVNVSTRGEIASYILDTAKVELDVAMRSVLAARSPTGTGGSSVIEQAIPIRSSADIMGGDTMFHDLLTGHFMGNRSLSMDTLKVLYRDKITRELNLPAYLPHRGGGDVLDIIKQHEALYNALANVIGYIAKSPSGSHFLRSIGATNPEVTAKILESREMWQAVKEIIGEFQTYRGDTGFVESAVLGQPPLFAEGMGSRNSLELVSKLKHQIEKSKIFSVDHFFGRGTTGDLVNDFGMTEFLKILWSRARALDSNRVPLPNPHSGPEGNLILRNDMFTDSFYMGSGHMIPTRLGEYLFRFEENTSLSEFLNAIGSELPGGQIGRYSHIKMFHDLYRRHKAGLHLSDPSQAFDPHVLTGGNFTLGPNDPLPTALEELFQIFDQVHANLKAAGFNPNNFLTAPGLNVKSLLSLLDAERYRFIAQDIVGVASGSVSHFAQRFSHHRGMPVYPWSSNAMELGDQSMSSSAIDLIDAFTSRYTNEAKSLITPYNMLQNILNLRGAEILTSGVNIPMLTGSAPISIYNPIKTGNLGPYRSMDELMDVMRPFDPKIRRLANQGLGIPGAFGGPISDLSNIYSPEQILGLITGGAIGLGALGATLLGSPNRAEAMSFDTNEFKIKSYYQAVRKLNQFISSGETSRISDPYNAINPLNAPSSVKLTEMTIGDVINYATNFAESFNNKNVTGAVGKYQNLPNLLKSRAIFAGFDLNTIYTPEVQEKIAEQYLLKTWNGNGIGVEEYLQGKTSLNSIIDRISRFYRGMPGSDGSYFGGGANVTGKNMSKLNTLKDHLITTKMRYMPGFKKGGFVKGAPSMPVPATLHGGEYILNANAVRNIGIPALNAINANKPKPPIVPPSKEVRQYGERQGKKNERWPRGGRPLIPMPLPPMGGWGPPRGNQPGLGGEKWQMKIPTPMMPSNNYRFAPPASRIGSVQAPVTNNVSTVNIQVENFVGQEEWFNSMMKEYNVNVLPKNQKLAGLESRRFTSYNGINQGM